MFLGEVPLYCDPKGFRVFLRILPQKGEVFAFVESSKHIKDLQGYLAYKKMHPPRTLQQDYA